jgi:hypothetical protein
LIAISVILSTPATASAPVIPITVESICGLARAKLIGALVIVQAEPLFVDGVNAPTAVNALVEVPWNDCALLPVPVISICAPPAVADIVNAFALETVLTKTVPPSVIPVPAIAVPPPARYFKC